MCAKVLEFFCFSASQIKWAFFFLITFSLVLCTTKQSYRWSLEECFRFGTKPGLETHHKNLCRSEDPSTGRQPLIEKSKTLKIKCANPVKAICTLTTLAFKQGTSVRTIQNVLFFLVV